MKNGRKDEMRDPRDKIFIFIFTFLGLITLLAIYMLVTL
jgi:hypothetical protein